MNYTLTKEQVRHIFELGFIHGTTDVGRIELDKYLESISEKEETPTMVRLNYSDEETFTYKGLILICESCGDKGCEGCYFDDKDPFTDCTAEDLDCAFPSRIFKLVK